MIDVYINPIRLLLVVKCLDDAWDGLHRYRNLSVFLSRLTRTTRRVPEEIAVCNPVVRILLDLMILFA
jgi:hypothetical protein